MAAIQMDALFGKSVEPFNLYYGNGLKGWLGTC